MKAVLRIRIRDPVLLWPLDPGSGIGRKSASGSEIRDEQPGSYFLELRNHFLGLKYLKFFDADPGSGMETVRIINILDPQHCMKDRRFSFILCLEQVVGSAAGVVQEGGCPGRGVQPGGGGRCRAGLPRSLVHLHHHARQLTSQGIINQ